MSVMPTPFDRPTSCAFDKFLGPAGHLSTVFKILLKEIDMRFNNSQRIGFNPGITVKVRNLNADPDAFFCGGNTGDHTISIRQRDASWQCIGDNGKGIRWIAALSLNCGLIGLIYDSIGQQVGCDQRIGRRWVPEFNCVHTDTMASMGRALKGEVNLTADSGEVDNTLCPLFGTGGVCFEKLPLVSLRGFIIDFKRIRNIQPLFHVMVEAEATGPGIGAKIDSRRYQPGHMVTRICGEKREKVRWTVSGSGMSIILPL